MIKYILVACGIALVIAAYPIIVLLAAIFGAGYLLCIILNTGGENAEKPGHAVDSIPVKVYDPDVGCDEFGKGGVVDQTEKSCKPGFRDNPEWQEKSAKLRKTIAANKKASESELNVENNGENISYWAKKR